MVVEVKDTKADLTVVVDHTLVVLLLPVILMVVTFLIITKVTLHPAQVVVGGTIIVTEDLMADLECVSLRISFDK